MTDPGFSPAGGRDSKIAKAEEIEETAVAAQLFTRFLPRRQEFFEKFEKNLKKIEKISKKVLTTSRKFAKITSPRGTGHNARSRYGNPKSKKKSI